MFRIIGAYVRDGKTKQEKMNRLREMSYETSTHIGLLEDRIGGI